MNYSMSFILSKLKIYLNQKGSLTTTQKKFLKNLETNRYGYCHGFTTLVLFGLYQQARLDFYSEKLFSKENLKRFQEFNYSWFKDMVILLNGWNNDIKDLSLTEQVKLDELTYLLERFQHSNNYFNGLGQGQFERIVGSSFKREYSLAGEFAKQHFFQELEYVSQDIKKVYTLFEILSQPNRIVIISSFNHDIGFIRIADGIIFYNSNAKKGCRFYPVNNKQKLEELINTIFIESTYDPSRLSPFSFRVFSPQDVEPGIYPSPTYILTALKLRQAPSYARDYADGTNALHAAAFINCIDSASYYLSLPDPIDINARNKDNESALFMAISQNNKEMFDFFRKQPQLKQPQQLVVSSKEIQLAVLYGRVDLLERLLNHSAISHIKTEMTSKLLCLVASNGYIGIKETMELLIQSGADIHHTNSQKETPLNLVISNSNANYKERINAIQMLVKYGANLEAKNREGLSPYQCAMKNGYVEIMHTLASVGAKINLSGHFCSDTVNLKALAVNFFHDKNRVTISQQTSVKNSRRKLN